MSRTKTQHFQKRISQRGIRAKLLPLVQQFGVKQGDKTVLNRKGLDCAIKELNNLKRKLTQLKDKGGIVYVSVDNVSITAYDVDSFNKY